MCVCLWEIQAPPAVSACNAAFEDRVLLSQEERLCWVQHSQKEFISQLSSSGESELGDIDPLTCTTETSPGETVSGCQSKAKEPFPTVPKHTTNNPSLEEVSFSSRSRLVVSLWEPNACAKTRLHIHESQTEMQVLPYCVIHQPLGTTCEKRKRGVGEEKRDCLLMRGIF